MNTLIETVVAWHIARQLDAFKSSPVPALPIASGFAEVVSDVLFSVILAVADEAHIDRLALSLEALQGAGPVPFEVILAHPLTLAEAIDTLTRGRFAAMTVRTIAIPAATTTGALRAAALRAASGIFVGFLDAGDSLEAGALAYLAPLAVAYGTEIIYSDEDWLGPEGANVRPRLKTGWDPDAQLGRDLLGRLAFLRAATVRKVGGYRLDHAPAELYDLHCRVAFAVPPASVRHVPVVLCHRSMVEIGDEEEPVAAYLNAARDVAAATAHRTDPLATVTPAPLAPFLNRVHWPLPEPPPLVSILVPTRDRVDLLRGCIEGVLARTDYSNFEVLILDNESSEAETFAYFAEAQADLRVRVVPSPGPFNFSRINNRGAARARGQVLLFLNNDIEVIGGGWLREMISHAMRPDVGCVGGRLLYGDRHVQHAGVVLQPGPLAMHLFRRREEGYLGFDAQLAGVRSYAAVTAACLAVRRDVFERVGGFDEERLQVSFQDVDLCLKVEERGFRNVCTPFEPLLHLEGASRSTGPVSPEKAARERREVMCLFYRWADRFDDDRAGHPGIKLDWEQQERTIPVAAVDALTLAR